MKTNQKTLKRMLSIISSVTISRWSIVREIVDIYPSIVEIEKECVDYWYSHKFDLSKIGTWSTYDNTDCISLRFYIENNGLYCDVVIWNGDNVYGSRRGKRFTAKLQLPMSFILKISSSIDYKYNDHLNFLYDDYLLLQRKLWVDNAKKELLNN